MKTQFMTTDQNALATPAKELKEDNINDGSKSFDTSSVKRVFMLSSLKKSTEKLDQ